jgi:hypothetical protein
MSPFRSSKLPKSTNPFTHNADAKALQQMKAAFPNFLNGGTGADLNVGDCNIMFKVIQPDPTDITEAALDAGTGFNIRIEAQVEGEVCKWFNGYIGYNILETAVGGGAIAIDDAGDHVTFVEGVASMAVTPAGAWAVNDTFVAIPTGNLAGFTLTNGTNYDVSADVITVVE